MVMTDIATGWTECQPVVVRSGALVIEALASARTLFPFALRGVDFDSDGLFVNEPVAQWCRDKRLEVTRSRAYRKNDQAWVEQKNGAIVRRMVGYGRLEAWRPRKCWPGSMPRHGSTPTCSSRRSSCSRRHASAPV